MSARLLLLAVVFAACSDGAADPELIGSPRRGPGDEAGLRDARPADGGGGAADATPDVSPPLDAAPEVDAAPEADAAPDTSLEPDVLPVDAAPMPDALPRDAAPPDALAPDAAPASVCGDGAPEGDEACDDGNTRDGDYCSADCRAVTGRCGDGELQDNERCDDGVVQEGCDALHDGGDGACVPPGECVEGFVLVGDACQPAEQRYDVNIFVANDCTMRVMPERVQVPRGQTALLSFHNISRDYPVDVWMSYGGGFLDLPVGQTWDDPIDHCTGPRRPREEFADITTACSEYRLPIECL